MTFPDSRSITLTEPEPMLATKARVPPCPTATMCDTSWPVVKDLVTRPTSTSTSSSAPLPSAVTSTRRPSGSQRIP